jgi:sialidase-1
MAVLALLLPIMSQPSVPALSPGCLPKDNQTDLWCPGARGQPPAEGDEAVRCYKIPSLLRTQRGTLLAFVEARRLQCGDGGLVDLHLRRSLTGGSSWLATQDVVVNDEVVDAQHITWGDACPVQDRSNGRVHLILTRNNADVYAMHSDDEGGSWSTPRNISAMVDGHRAKGSFVGTGHAGGVQLRDGRLLVPLHGPCRFIFSDDGGESWALAPGSLSAGGECQAVEIRRGLLLATARNGQEGHTYLAFSTDGGVHWNASVPNPDLPSPIDGCEASLVAHPNGLLYHSAPDSYLLRTNMVVRASADGGRTWTIHRRVWASSAGYSSMVVLGEGADAPLGLLYDRNNVSMIIFEARGVTFTAVPTTQAGRHQDHGKDSGSIQIHGSIVV